MDKDVARESTRPAPAIPAELPDDPAALKALLLEQQRRIAGLEQRKAELEFEKFRLEHQLAVLLKRYYGPRADVIQPAQLALEFAIQLEARPVEPLDLPPQDDVANVIRRVRRGRRNLADYDHLPVIRVVHDLPQDQQLCPCCHDSRAQIGEETTWQIEYFPGYFARIEHVQIKRACRRCELEAAETGPQIVLADKPLAPIDKGMAGPGLLAYVVTSKFSDYLPLYRLEQIFERNGFVIDRSTLCLWARDVAELIKPVYDLMVQRVLQSHLVHTDDTVMPMLAPEKTKQARLWVYIGDAQHPYDVFDFTLSRSRDGPAKFLQDFHGVLQADAYGGYDGICAGQGIIQAGCWAHGRRKLTDTQTLEPAITAPALELIGQLFALERQAQLLKLNPAQHLAWRQENSVPVLADLQQRLAAWKGALLPKHPVSQALGYLQNQWGPLTVFTTDPAIALDNNVAERDMKRAVLNRKNSLFVGNERGGQTAAILSSITATCRRHHINPQLYLTQLLTNLPATPISQVNQWLPDVWQKRTLPTPPAPPPDPAHG